MRILIVAAVLALALPAAAEKRGPGEAPVIELADAVAKARAYAAKNKIDLSKQYLQAADFDPVLREWGIAWQKARAKGGRIEFVVHEEGKIDVRYGE